MSWLSFLFPCVFAAYWLSRVAVGPVRTRGLGRSAPRQIRLSDIFCLLFTLQAVLASWCFIFQHIFWTSTMLFLLATLWMLLGISWYHGVIHLNRARIEPVARRSLYLCLIMPAAYLLFISELTFLLFASAILIGTGRVPVIEILVFGACLLVIAYGLRQLSAWIAAASPFPLALDLDLDQKPNLPPKPPWWRKD